MTDAPERIKYVPQDVQEIRDAIDDAMKRAFWLGYESHKEFIRELTRLTEEQYVPALSYADKWMDAEPGSIEEILLVYVASLIEEYDEREESDDV